MDSLVKDILYGLRGLRKNPGFSTVAILTIALGIGACTAIFSVVRGVLLQPLPYADPDRLVLVWSELRARNVPDFPFPIPDVRDLRQESKTLEGVAGITASGRALIGGDKAEPEQVRNSGATTNLFSLLGAHIVVGRNFVDDDGTPQPPQPQPGAAATPAVPPPPPLSAILSYGFFQRRYGGDTSIVGKTIDFNNGKARIVGILAPGFELLFPPRTGITPDVDMWVALRLDFDNAARNTGVLRVIGRLKPGVSMTAAQTDAESIAATLRDRFAPKKNANLHIRVVPMRDDLTSEVRPSILALLGAVVFVLLIACANVANLLIVRAAARHRELVIRAAIGGSRARLLRQMLTESVILATLGAGAGLLLAQTGVETLVSMAPARLPRLNAIRIDPVVLAFTALTAIVTALVCGIVPAVRASRPDVADALRSGGRMPSLAGGRRLRASIVVAEVALSFALLIGFGLMVRSILAVYRMDPGYDSTNLLTFTLPARARDPEARNVFLRQVTERLRAVPGVVNVATSAPFPLDGGTANVPWATEDAGRVDPSAFRQANFFTVRPGYFETMKTRLTAGRTFTDDDNTADRAVRVVIDDMLAARAFPNQTAVGKTLLVRNLRGGGPNAPFNIPVEIIGVVAHQRHESLLDPGREAIFFTDAFFGFGGGRWAVRTAADPMATVSAVRAVVAAIDPRLPISEVQPMQAFVERAMAPVRFTTTLIGAFAVMAVVLAAVGLYGVLTTIVRQRSSEIGMRLVFGAPRGSILRMVVGEGLKMSGIGVVLGVITALVMTRVIRSIVVGTSPTDPLTFVAMTVLFGVVAIAATWVPAYRASTLDPIVAIREE